MFEVKMSEGRQQITVFSAPSHSCRLSSSHMNWSYVFTCPSVICIRTVSQTCSMAWSTYVRHVFVMLTRQRAHIKHSHRALSKIFPEDWMTICLALSIWVNQIPLWPMEPVWSYWCEWQHLMCATRMSCWVLNPTPKPVRNREGKRLMQKVVVLWQRKKFL